MNKQETEELLKINSTPCVSVIVPVHHISPDRVADKDAVRRVVSEAKNLLARNAEAGLARTLQNKLDEISGSINYLNNANGIGIFICEGLSKLVNFSFPVEEKVIVSNCFDSRDLLYELFMTIEYVVLNLSKKEINLFHGERDTLKKVNDTIFPLKYEETYIYSKPSYANSYSVSTLKSYEKDKSVLQEARFKEFARHADEQLGKYIHPGMPFIITGTAKQISEYKEISGYGKSITGVVEGNYEEAGKQLSQLSWKCITDNIKKENRERVARAKELIGKRMIAVGIEESRRAAEEGMGMVLLVEKNLEIPNSETHETARGVNVVDEVIRTVLGKKGKVVFLEKDELKDLHGIALLLRYNNL